MLHKFLEKGAWFRAKKYGYGASLPFKWQGWVLLLVHAAFILGVAVMLDGRPQLQLLFIFVMGLAPLPIYAARTEGGWRWRNGNDL